MATQIAYDEAAKAIAEGKATPHALWVLLREETDRDGYAIKPSLWEGPGQYQRVKFDDGRDVFVRLPLNARPLSDIANAEGR